MYYHFVKVFLSGKLLYFVIIFPLTHKYFLTYIPTCQKGIPITINMGGKDEKVLASFTSSLFGVRYEPCQR